MKKLFYLVIALSLFLRFFLLGEIPNGVSNDEIGYIYSAYSIWETGKDVAGVTFPLSINLDNSFSPVNVYLTAPFVGLFGLTPLWGRFPFALLGVGTIVLFYFLIKRIFDNEKIAFLSTLAFAISPWHLQLSRAAQDAVMALFFYVAGIYIFVLKEKKGSILWSLPFFLLAFYSYHGAKIFFVTFIPFLVWYYRKDIIQRKRELALFITGVVLILLSFLYVSQTQQVTRQQMFFFSNSENATRVIDKERTLNTASAFLRPLLSNKPLYYLRVFRENYFEAFSPQFLFLHGENSGVAQQYGTLYRGVMYIFELPLLLIGLYFLITKKRKLAVFIIGGLLIAPLSSAFTTDRSYINRSIMMLPFLMAIVGFGAYMSFQWLSSRRKLIRHVVVWGFSMWVVLIFTIYLYQYYFRYPVYGAEAWFYSSRTIAKRMYEEKDRYKTIYFAPGNSMYMLQYAFHNKIEPEKVQAFWKKQNNGRIENVEYLPTCLPSTHSDNPFEVLDKDTLYISHEGCHINVKPTEVVKDYAEPLQTRWKIFRI